MNSNSTIGKYVKSYENAAFDNNLFLYDREILKTTYKAWDTEFDKQ